VYQVELDKMYSEKLNTIVAAGVRLNYRETASAKVLHVRHMKKHSVVTLELREGLNREIHRMFKVLGYKVMDLDRISYGGIFTGPVKLGQWRHLSTEEIQKLKELCGIT